MLAHTGKECVTLPENKCRTIASPRISLGAGAVRTVDLACVRKFPYVVGWDASHHEHIGLALVSALPDRSAGELRDRGVGEPEGFIQLAVGKQTPIGGDSSFRMFLAGRNRESQAS